MPWCECAPFQCRKTKCLGAPSICKGPLYWWDSAESAVFHPQCCTQHKKTYIFNQQISQFMYLHISTMESHVACTSSLGWVSTKVTLHRCQCFNLPRKPCRGRNPSRHTKLEDRPARPLVCHKSRVGSKRLMPKHNYEQDNENETHMHHKLSIVGVCYSRATW